MNNNPEDWEGQEGGERQQPCPEGLSFLYSSKYRADNRTDTIKNYWKNLKKQTNRMPHGKC